MTLIPGHGIGCRKNPSRAIYDVKKDGRARLGKQIKKPNVIMVNNYGIVAKNKLKNEWQSSKRSSCN